MTNHTAQSECHCCCTWTDATPVSRNGEWASSTWWKDTVNPMHSWVYFPQFIPQGLTIYSSDKPTLMVFTMILKVLSGYRRSIIIIARIYCCYVSATASGLIGYGGSHSCTCWVQYSILHIVQEFQPGQTFHPAKVVYSHWHHAGYSIGYYRLYVITPR
jgi:hypothetical protein